MEKLGVFIVTSLILVLLTVLVAGWASTQAAEENRTQALVIHAQGQAALDRAQAAAAQLGAVAGVIGAVGVVIAGLAAVVGILVVAGLLIQATAAVSTAAITGVVALSRKQPPQIVVRHVVYLPRPGQRRSEVWRQLSTGQSDLVLPGPEEGKR